jgi:quercetin dioxygenase-like cupin family protein
VSAKSHAAALCLVASSLGLTAVAQTPAEAPPIKRTPLQRFDVPGTLFETVIGVAEIAPSVAIGRHAHPGSESGCVMAGSLELLIDGQAPRLLKDGDSYQVPPGAVHDAKAGPEGAEVIATCVVQKRKPLSTPAAP